MLNTIQNSHFSLKQLTQIIIKQTSSLGIGPDKTKPDNQSSLKETAGSRITK